MWRGFNGWRHPGWEASHCPAHLCETHDGIGRRRKPIQSAPNWDSVWTRKVVSFPSFGEEPRPPFDVFSILRLGWREQLNSLIKDWTCDEWPHCWRTSRHWQWMDSSWLQLDRSHSFPAKMRKRNIVDHSHAISRRWNRWYGRQHREDTIIKYTNINLETSPQAKRHELSLQVTF